MSDTIKELSDLLRKLDVPIQFGLRAQGHLQKIREMVAAGSSWDDIGAAIGWQAQAAREWFDREDFADRMLAADRKRIREELLAAFDVLDGKSRELTADPDGHWNRGLRAALVSLRITLDRILPEEPAR